MRYQVMTADEFEALADLIKRVHEATVDAALPREEYQLPFDNELEQGITASLTREPPKGPYGTRIRELIHDNHGHLDTARTELRELAGECRRDNAPFVLTHGEPIGNGILVPDGRLLLLDWGSAALGPPERDCWDFTYLPAMSASGPDFSASTSCASSSAKSPSTPHASPRTTRATTTMSECGATSVATSG